MAPVSNCPRRTADRIERVHDRSSPPTGQPLPTQHPHPRPIRVPTARCGGAGAIRICLLPAGGLSITLEKKSIRVRDLKKRGTGLGGGHPCPTTRAEGKLATQGSGARARGGG